MNVTDEDVARGHLEDSWVPVLCFYVVINAGAAADAPTGTLTFFECSWQLFQFPCGTWATSVTDNVVVMRKTRMPCAPHEELFVEPIAIEDVQEGMVIACKVIAPGPDVGDHLAVCCGRHSDGPRLRLIGYNPAGGGNKASQVHCYHFFSVCKQPSMTFVLK